MNGVYGDMSIEVMLRKFKKVTERANVLGEMRLRQHYEKPSEIRRKKEKDAIRRMRLDRLESEGKYKRKKPY